MDHSGPARAGLRDGWLSEGLYAPGETQEKHGCVQQSPSRIDSPLYRNRRNPRGLGLILPRLTRIVPQLTIAAVLGLVLLMICASVFHASRKEYRSIGVNMLLLLLAACIAVSYLVWVPVA
ncbi:DoxX family protein [Ktedonospora formicarum]|uniref:DoxX family protein n=1 Tax=Ktedonospora formicarum TaxID=2778364 RepID=UPI001C68AF9B|nr:DoxX family protein [Ktedonospora formicarum]